MLPSGELFVWLCTYHRALRPGNLSFDIGPMSGREVTWILIGGLGAAGLILCSALQVPLQAAVRAGLLAVASTLLLRFPGEIRRYLLALRIKPVDWQEKVGTKNACNESLLFGSHLSC
jgi:hypothetical protein